MPDPERCVRFDQKRSPKEAAERIIADRLSALLDEHRGPRPDDEQGPAGAAVPTAG